MSGSRLKTALLGLLTSLVLLELTVRLIGGGVRLQQWLRNRSLARSEVRILCLGESTTYMGGSLSWPAQLQEQLQRALPGTRVAVYNGAAPGVNSSYLVEHLDEQLRQYKPQIVITMMGANDTGRNIPFTAIEQPQLPFLLRELRSYRLLHYLAAQMRPEQANRPVVASQDLAASGQGDYEPFSQRRMSEPLRQAMELVACGDLTRNIPLLEQALEVDPDDPRPYIWLLERKLATGQDLTGVRAQLHQLISRYPEHAFPYVAMAACSFSEADLYYKQAAHKDYVYLCKVPQLSNRYVQFLQRSGLDDEAAKYFACLERNNPSAIATGLAYSYWSSRLRPDMAAPYAARLRMLHDHCYEPQTRANFGTLYQRAHKDGFELVCASYANRSSIALQAIFEGADDVVLVDNLQPFRGYVDQGRYDEVFTDRCNGDMGHATPLGNRLIATNIARALLRLGLGNPSKVSASGR